MDPCFLYLDTMRQYIQQIRHETGVRVAEKVFDPTTDKPSKVQIYMFNDLVHKLC